MFALKVCYQCMAAMGPDGSFDSFYTDVSSSDEASSGHMFGHAPTRHRALLDEQRRVDAWHHHIRLPEPSSAASAGQ